MRVLSGDPRRQRALALAATLLLLGFAFIGRAVLSADDGAEMTADTLGFLVQGRFESAVMPPGSPKPFIPPPPAFRSRYGLVPSLVPLPALALAWPLRGLLGARGVDAVAALTWALGALLAALAFHRLARALKPGTSPLWVPAFLGGTFLWAYAADSFVEPFAAAALALSAAALLDVREVSPWRAGLGTAAGWVFACWLRPVAWVTAPVLVLAALLEYRRRRDGTARALWLLGGLFGGLAAVALLNLVRHGSASDFGHGFGERVPFVHGALEGFVGTTLLPGRGVVFYAPIVLAALAMTRRLAWSARVLLFGTPLVLVLVSSRWYEWHGGSCWGPRYLLPALPLLAVPAVLAPRRLTVPLVAAGVLVNLSGVLVAAGAWQGYADTLVAPPGAAWPPSGGDRVSDVPTLSPLVGHPWLLANALSGGRLGAPWLSAGARETAPRPVAAQFISPWIVRRLAGLPPIAPFLPRLLVRSAAAYLVRGRPAEAARFAEAALSLDPTERDAPRVLDAARHVAR